MVTGLHLKYFSVRNKVFPESMKNLCGSTIRSFYCHCRFYNEMFDNCLKYSRYCYMNMLLLSFYIRLYHSRIKSRILHLSHPDRLLVGTPRDKAEPNVPANQTGGVYSCPITADQSDCSRIKLVDQGETHLYFIYFMYIKEPGIRFTHGSPPCS